jgi:hypothetical protein
MGLRERITNTAHLKAWEGTIGVSFQYTAGAAGQRFFEVLRTRGRLAVTRCPECGTTYLPPRVYCPRDFQDLSTRWDEVAPRGTVHSFTVVHRDSAGEPLAVGRLIGFVAIDGTDGGLLVPLDLDPAAVRIGRPVEAVLRPPGERQGTIEDIIAFR